MLVDHVKASRRIVILTGAGMSAESGIKTFRDALDGIWAEFDPSVLATVEGFEQDPSLVWGWYEGRRRDVIRAAPNAGHVALSRLAECSWLEDVTVVTQNVDDLHERAGSRQVIHLHGSLFAPRCMGCGMPHRGSGEMSASTDAGSEAAGRLAPPRCIGCGGLVRPGVVWFGEDLPRQQWLDAMACVELADVVLVVGTSGLIHPAALLPERARDAGAQVWVINPDSSTDWQARRFWPATAAQGLPALVGLLD